MTTKITATLKLTKLYSDIRFPYKQYTVRGCIGAHKPYLYEMAIQMDAKWDADTAANFRRRLGKSAHELGITGGNASCPEVWELDNGDVAVIGTDLTTSYAGRLPAGVSVDPGERLVIIPRSTIVSAKTDIPDA